MLGFLLLISFTYSLATVEKIACFDQVVQSLNALGTIEIWRDFPGGRAGSFSGGTVELYLNKSSTKLITRSKKSVMRLLFEKSACKARHISTTKALNEFTDFDLAKLLSENSQGIIYLWSTHMNLSKRERETLQGLKYPVTLIQDFPTSSGGKVLSKDSVISLQNPVHYPQTFFYREGKIIKMVPGVHNGLIQDVAQGIFE